MFLERKKYCSQIHGSLKKVIWEKDNILKYTVQTFSIFGGTKPLAANIHRRINMS